MNKCDDLKITCEKQIAYLTGKVNKLNAGKFTFRSLFKSDSEKKADAMAKETERAMLMMDLNLYDDLKKYLTIYLATIAIPNYEEQRNLAYIRAMGRMSDVEVRNMENTHNFWTAFQKTVRSLA